MTMLKAPSISLPLDVFELIISMLAEQRATLTALSLVRNDFSDICQRHLFSIIVLALHTPRMLEALVEVLESSPRLTRYIKTLNLTVFSNLFNNAQLSWVLDHLPNIQSLTLYTSYKVHWDQCSHQLQLALMRATQSPKLCEFKLKGHGSKEAAIALLVRPPNLRHLFLYWGSEDIEQTHILTPVEADEDLKTSQLETLDMGGKGMETLACLLHAKRRNNCYAVGFSQIRRISIHIAGGDRIETALELFSRLLCLEDLDIDVRGASSLITVAMLKLLMLNATGFIQLGVPDLMARILKKMNPSSMKTLRRLKANMSLFSLFHDPLMGLPDGLAHMPAENNLREICITVSVDGFGYSSSHSREWDPLDEVLGDRSRFTRLESIDILVESTGMSEDDAGLVMGMAEGCFSNTRKIYGTNFEFRTGQSTQGPSWL